MAAPSLTDGALSEEGLPYVLDAVLGSFWGKVLLADVGVAICVCTLAIQTAGSRLMFSMARDGRLPFSRRLAHVNPRTGTPIGPSVVIGVGCLLVLALNVGNAALFTTLTSVCIVLIYCAYLLVTVPMLWRRLHGWAGTRGMTDSLGAPLFSLGRWGLPVNVLAVVYGLAMTVNLAWPRSEIFDPDGTHPLMRWAGPITVAAAVVAGLLAYPHRRQHPNPVRIGE